MSNVRVPPVGVSIYCIGLYFELRYPQASSVECQAIIKTWIQWAKACDEL